MTWRGSAPASSPARSAPRTHRRRGRRWAGDRGHRRRPGPRPRAGLEDLAEHRDRAGHTTADLAEIEGPARITHIWLTTHPTTGAPFCCGPAGTAPRRPRSRCRSATSSARDGAGSPSSRRRWSRSTRTAGFNSYWPMPFREARAPHAREPVRIERPSSTTRSTYDRHRRVPATRLPARAVATVQPAGRRDVHTLVDGVRGHGPVRRHLPRVGQSTAAAGGARARSSSTSTATSEFPTICGTGTEDYFGGAWNFDVPGQGYTPFSTPYLGLHQVIRPDGLYDSQLRFGMYRWHVARPDPVRRGAAGHHPGAGLARGRPLPPAARRHRLDGPVLPRPPDRGPPGEPRPRRPGAPLTLAAPRP